MIEYLVKQDNILGGLYSLMGVSFLVFLGLACLIYIEALEYFDKDGKFKISRPWVKKHE